MKNLLFIPVALLFFLAAAVFPALAGTSITFTSAVPGLTVDTTDLEKKVQDLIEANGGFLSDAFFLSNITGYPIGKSHIGAFPHFQIGVANGVGCTNMAYFARSKDERNDGSFPMMVPNPVLHFGFGLTERTDFIGKFFMFTSGMYKPEASNSMVRVNEFNIYSAGGRFRYNIVQRTTVLPMVFSFGGITLGMGGDVMMGSVKADGRYRASYKSVNVTYGAFNQDVNLSLDSRYNADVNWAVYSATAQALAYFDFFYLFSFYTGMGLTGGYGIFNTTFTANGTLTSDVAIPLLGTTVGTMTMNSTNKYKPYPVAPTYILGLEINLLMLKLNLETMVNMRNGSDVTALVGTRMEF